MQTSLYLSRKDILREESCNFHLTLLWPLVRRMEQLYAWITGDCANQISASEPPKPSGSQSYMSLGGSNLRLGGRTYLYINQRMLAYRENAGEPDSWSSLSYEIPYGDCSVRHHRELDIYTLTSESQAHDKRPLPGDTCTGHICKLRNIQQQLMVRKKISIFGLLCPHPLRSVNLPIIKM